MKNAFMVICAGLLFAGLANAQDKAPAGWKIGNNHGADIFSIKVEKDASPNKHNSILIESEKAKNDDRLSLLQTIKANRYRGKRVELSANIKTEGVEGGVELWMRVDGRDKSELALNNMDKQPVTGATSWMRHAIDIDVPEDAGEIVFGVFLSGKGYAHIGDFDFQTISKSAPLEMVYSRLPADPVNLALVPDPQKGAAVIIPGWTMSTNANYKCSIKFSDGQNTLIVYGNGALKTDKFNLKQAIDVSKYKGKSIAFSAQLASKNVSNYAGLWVAVRNAEGKRTAHYDEWEQKTGLHGTAKFAEHKVVLYVRPDTAAIEFGIGMSGDGVVMVKGPNFSIYDSAPESPVNLGLN